MEQHRDEWETLVGSPDLAGALADHFAFLTDEPRLRDLVDELFEAAKRRRSSTTRSSAWSSSSTVWAAS